MILNRQRRVRIPIRSLERFAATAMALLRLPAGSVTICFVSSREMTGWNRTYRGKDKPTDVLSFPFGDGGQTTRAKSSKDRVKPSKGAKSKALHSSESAYLGDIAIAPLVARDNAFRFGRTFEAEMRILILHGILHLMGYDHETDSGQMQRREGRLRQALGLN